MIEIFTNKHNTIEEKQKEQLAAFFKEQIKEIEKLLEEMEEKNLEKDYIEKFLYLRFKKDKKILRII
ncbi:hypothetical protein [Candidatus Uabimicrobium amorphum]|uniref:Uncharacterized protein n=1 Tax=Uabimicrobium amorphum TaxID=2596890 RepID=A0A5S9F3G3_UABAM|nr:hypothetical protein [Candidatus Uabimicrobium amorphum]BBM83404.1 hypothetical protein UABAM_01756 [Candidatus Uabimicrobium amorphum]